MNRQNGFDLGSVFIALLLASPVIAVFVILFWFLGGN